MQLHRLGFPCHHPALFNLLRLSSLSCAAAVSCAAVVSCVVNVVVEREKADVVVCDECLLFGMRCTRE